MEFTAPSGAKVVINPAPWVAAKALKKAIGREVIDIGTDAGTDAILSHVLKVDCSDEVDAALWPCLARCTRNEHKIIEATFDDLEARKDYYEIAFACAKENLSPLVESLFSKLLALGLIKKQAKESPAST
jgi:hypothetical protein